MSKVNTTPVGLQNLLGNINQGENPSELGQIIAPTTDLYPHWAARKIQHDFTYNSIAQGGVLAIPIPEGELWQMIAMSLTKDNELASDDLHLTVGVSPSTGSGDGNYVRLAQMDHTANVGTTGGTQSLGFTFPDRFILSGGWIVKGVVESATATAQDAWLNVLYVKLTD